MSPKIIFLILILLDFGLCVKFMGHENNILPVSLFVQPIHSETDLIDQQMKIQKDKIEVLEKQKEQEEINRMDHEILLRLACKDLDISKDLPCQH